MIQDNKKRSLKQALIVHRGHIIRDMEMSLDNTKHIKFVIYDFKGEITTSQVFPEIF